MIVWRISEYADLSGEGGLAFPGRWNHRGTRIVYCTDHPSTAMLEVLVHTDLDLLPSDLQLLKIDLGDKFQLENPELEDGWQTSLNYTRDLWETYCLKNTGPGWVIPSVLVPHATNYLLNPAHEIAQSAAIVYKIRFPVDQRFFA